MMLGPELSFEAQDYVVLDGVRLLYLAGIDYHRMSNHPMIIEAAREAALKYGLNATGSRATTGNHTLYGQLEQSAARFFGSEQAVVLPSGYLSNTVLLQAIEDDFDTFFIDELSHSSLFEAARLFDKPIVRFNHTEAQSLEAQLKRQCAGHARPLVLTDGVFPAQGEMPPLKDYSDIIEPYNGKMLVDDAHAMAVIGATGKGSWEAQGLNRASIFQAGTLSKGFGVGGGIIPADTDLAEKIRTKSPAFTGCTGLALPLAAAAIESIAYVTANLDRVTDLQTRSLALKRQFSDLGFAMPYTPTPIFSITHHDVHKNERLKRSLLAQGIYPPFIHYPGSPKGGHFRFILTSATTQDQETLLLKTIEASL
ncbi:MAG: pyridoxal phosphate-dependent aminotransferase family protein [Planctomycetes bacterium]|nr:pyridoxal phosphate-dependent aminotransferase family protein [Planctomycetota bacterium]